MRVFAVTPYYSPEGGGLERYAHAILSGLASRGHEVEVAAFTRGAPERVRLDGVLVDRVRPRLQIGNAPVHPGFYTMLRERLRAYRPDVVVGHTPVPFAAEMAFLAARSLGIPFVTTYHAGRLRGSNLPLDALASLDRATMQRRMLTGSARIIAVSDYVRRHAIALAAPTVDVVPPGVHAPGPVPGPPADPPIILFVAPLATSYRWKGVDVLLDAFALVRQRVPTARLLLVGEGDRCQEIAARALEFGGAVEVAGRLAEDRLKAAYERCSVLALPSTTDAEAFGMVLAEANAAGRPVVASNIGGIPDFVHDGENGLLAAPGDPRDLAQKLVTVLLDPTRARAMGLRGLQRVRRFHDWSRLTRATEAVLQKAASGQRTAFERAAILALLQGRSP